MTRRQGPLTAAKLDAARELGIPVVVVRRPAAAAAPVLGEVAQVVRLLTEGDA